MKKSKIKKKWIIIGSILLVLVIGRLCLPYFVTRYVNRVLSEIPGYHGSIYDVDISLIRGAYRIDSLKIFKVNGNEKVPFVDIPTSDLSVEWSALFKGSIVGEVVFDHATLNFIGGGKDKTNQSGDDVDWTVPIKKLMKLQINRLQIKNGTIFFYDFTTKPKVDLNLYNLELLATNLNNANKQKDRLPSTVTASATSIGGGDLRLKMDINVLQKIPDLDMDLKFEGIKMPALNDFFRAYAAIDVEKGTFSLYSEMTVDKGVISGYVKPIALDIKILTFEKDKDKPLNMVWQAVAGFFVEIFTNQKEDQFATRVPLRGDLNKVDAKVWPTVWNIFRNAFISAFEKNTENSVKFVARQATKPPSKRDKKANKK